MQPAGLGGTTGRRDAINVPMQGRTCSSKGQLSHIHAFLLFSGCTIVQHGALQHLFCDNWLVLQTLMLVRSSPNLALSMFLDVLKHMPAQASPVTCIVDTRDQEILK